MIEWWRNRNERERLFLSIGAVLAACILLYAVLAPLLGGVAKTRARIASKQEDLRWIEAAAPQVLASGSGAGAERATPDNALVIVDRVARESGLGASVTRVEPAGANGLQAILRGAPFDNVVAWLARLRQQHGVAIAALSVEPGSAAGLVNASVQFKVGP